MSGKIKRNYKLVVFDLDGTVYDNGKMSQNTIEVLRLLKSKGVILAINTGRHCTMVNDITLSTADYLISSNGAEIVEIAENKAISSTYLGKELVDKFFTIANKYDSRYSIFCDEKVYVDKKYIELNNYRKVPIFTRIGILLFFKQRTNVSKSALLEVQDKKESIIKINCKVGKNSDLPLLLEELKNLPLEIAILSENEVELTLNGTDKGSGINKLADLLSINKKEIIAFGDSGNDLSMLNNVGFFVATGNASKEVLDKADFIAENVENDGVSKVLNQIYDLGYVFK